MPTFILAIAAIPIVLYLIRSVQIGQRWERVIKFRLKRTDVALCLYLTGAYVWAHLGHSLPEAITLGVLTGVAGGSYFVRETGGSRRM